MGPPRIPRMFDKVNLSGKLHRQIKYLKAQTIPLDSNNTSRDLTHPTLGKGKSSSQSTFGMGYVSSLEGKMSPNRPFQKENCLEFHHQKNKKTLRWSVGFNKMKSLPDMQPRYSMRLVYLPSKLGRLEWTCKYNSPIWVPGIWLSKFTEMPRMYVIFPFMFLFWMEKCRSTFLSGLKPSNCYLSNGNKTLDWHSWK